MLKDQYSFVREAAAEALARIDKIDIKTIPAIIAPIKEYSFETSLFRALAHIVGGGDEHIEIILKWLGNPGHNLPEALHHDEAVKTLQVFQKVWDASEPFADIREDLAKQIDVVVTQRDVAWTSDMDIDLLTALRDNLEKKYPSQAKAIDSKIDAIKNKELAFNITKIWFLHASFWLILIFAYPKSVTIQAIFFWNPYVRIILGFPYVNLALTWVPFLKHRLFIPFKTSLLADAALNNFDDKAYFKESKIRRNDASQIEAYLISRQNVLIDDISTSPSKYEQACKDYIDSALNVNQPPEVLNSNQSILSNPMDLDIVAKMLTLDVKPDLFNLQQQQYKMMAADYEQRHVGNKFPLTEFSEVVYQMRLNDQSSIPISNYVEEIRCMERHKLVLSRQSVDAEENPTKDWFFRHDKIMDYFIVQSFIQNEERSVMHMGDPRFRGAYFLLAHLLPWDAAMDLREELIQYAAETKDVSVSHKFVQLIRERKNLKAAESDHSLLLARSPTN